MPAVFSQSSALEAAVVMRVQVCVDLGGAMRIVLSKQIHGATFCGCMAALAALSVQACDTVSCPRMLVDGKCILGNAPAAGFEANASLTTNPVDGLTPGTGSLSGVDSNGAAAPGAGAGPGGNSSGFAAPGLGAQAGISGGGAFVAICGNAVIEVGETCDPPESCPTESSCVPGNTCLRSMLQGDPSACTSTCQTVEVLVCEAGDGCCAKGCSSATDGDCSQACGDGMVGAGETCEASSQMQPCPTSCDDGAVCTLDMLTGDIATCNLACASIPITAPAPGDGCCPPGATANMDSDCTAVCGNRAVEAGEDCDGNCDAMCNDQMACTADSAVDCRCMHQNLTANPSARDGCCPDGADANADGDCSATCGNNSVEVNEECDGDCARKCDDGIACTKDGSAMCRCTHERLVANLNAKDGCCPDKANANTDSDCRADCGNDLIEAGEECDGNCAQHCDDGDPCTIESPQDCKCMRTQASASSTPDGCCIDADESFNANTDADCSPECGNNVEEGDEKCDGSSCPTEATCGSTDECNVGVILGENCRRECFRMILEVGPMDGCCHPGENTTTDPDCKAQCDNGVTEEDEGCDVDCPTSVEDCGECPGDCVDCWRLEQFKCGAICFNVGGTCPRPMQPSG